jgi:hypothetical protein
MMDTASTERQNKRRCVELSEPIREEPTSPRTEGPTYRREVPPQPLRPVEERPYVAEAEGQYDLVHWAPTWAGMFISIAALLLLAPLGVAIGLSSGTGAVVWGFISVIVAFFAGGWVVGRTLSFEDSQIAAAHGLLSWAVTLSFLLLAAFVLGAIGVAALTGLTNVIPSIVAPTQTVAGASLATFLAFLVSALASVAGSVTGNQARPYLRRIP